MTSTKQILIKAKETVAFIRGIKDEKINEALLMMAESLVRDTDKILCANQKDIELAKDRISAVMIDRLTLTDKRIAAMADGIREITKLPSPLGKKLRETSRPNGLLIEKVSVPMGVIAIIYESRPNVTSDAAALALKSGNVCILRGGKEAYNSARAIVDALEAGLEAAGLPKSAVQLVSDTTRESAAELMKAKDYVDLLIPRGGKGLITSCVENATVPCLETGTGICHIYVDRDADIDMALSIIENAKTSRPSVCNAAEVCLIHEDIAKEFLPKLKERLVDKRTDNPVELRCDGRALEIIDATPLGDEDFDTEFLDYILAVGIVGSVKEAVTHILNHSTQHSEAIITNNTEAAEYFTENTDSAAVYVNASTRFTDGGEFGLGCEMGISTQKMHARGPLGIEELTTYKYIVRGNGQTR
ncbi:MAG: glutamate-5-semialdehyde dehydrogenase [Ruminococcaceae bacterium]|nr:glutamate-5-semialdehyde dehydrogenase [Oscillospiraceae bacterium]